MRVPTAISFTVKDFHLLLLAGLPAHYQPHLTLTGGNGRRRAKSPVRVKAVWYQNVTVVRRPRSYADPASKSTGYIWIVYALWCHATARDVR